MTQFDKDYIVGKQSEQESLPILNQIFETDLFHDEDDFAHFDFFNNNFMVELKTRFNTWFNAETDQFFTETKTGRIIEIDTLYFDSPKLQMAYQNIKKGCKKDYYVVWRLKNNQFYYWKMNWKGESQNRIDFYIEGQNRDCGHGYKQPRDVVNVRVNALSLFTSP
tara:strand:- start:563 stop:1057 length:495 start_codon:yes stop_codon:yes gene_type:complete